jgi:predicted metalloprotease with PDZ domain
MLTARLGSIALACAVSTASLGAQIPESPFSAVPARESRTPEQSLPRPVSYTVSLSHPERHLLHITLQIPPGRAEQNLQLPVWNALYQVRDFAQYVNWVRARTPSGRVANVRKVEKSRWQISGAENGAVVEYEIYADTPGPFGAQLNSHHAFLNLAEVLMFPVDDRAHTMTISFEIPEGWRVATPLESDCDSFFRAANYDRLVDSPVELGEFAERDFDENGGRYRVIVDAEAGDYDMEKIVGDVHKIVEAATSWMDDRPFNSYMFFYHFPRGPAGGGMEHAYSTAIDLSAEALKGGSGSMAGIASNGGSAALRGVTAHEFFHLWNVKRIRPQTLEPIDYTKENYTRALWFSEGVTSTAEGIIQLRAGLLDEKAYLSRLGDEITELERRPAHLTQSAEESSLDAWLEGNAYYRRPERSISYYNKGELLGTMLDLEVREASRGRASLREVFQWMNRNYAKQGRFFKDSEGVRDAAEAVTHMDLRWFFEKYVAGTDELPWNEFLRTVGLRVVETSISVPDPGFSASRNLDGPITVEAVTAGGDAERAGLRVGDIVLEIQGNIPGTEMPPLNMGDTIKVKVRDRRGAEHEWRWKVGSHEEKSYEVRDLESTTPEQAARRAAWLKGEAQAGGDARR